MFHQTVMQSDKNTEYNTVNTLIFNKQFGTKSNSLLSNIKSTCYYSQLLTAELRIYKNQPFT